MQQFLSFIALKPKPGAEEGVRYAASNDRCMASAIDVMILFLLLGQFSDYVTLKVYSAFNQLPPGPGAAISNFSQLTEVLWQTRYPWLISNALIVAGMGVLYVACQWAYGTTPGKWLLGLKIVDEKTLAPIRGWRFVWRFISYFPACLPLMIGVLWSIFNKRHRGWHDYLAGTVVIYTRPKGWYWQQVKRGAQWVIAKMRGSHPPKQAMGEPPAEQRHENSPKPID